MDKEISTTIQVWGERYQNMKRSMQVWTLPKTENSLMLLGKYSAMSVGVGAAIEDKELLREMVGRLELLMVS